MKVSNQSLAYLSTQIYKLIPIERRSALVRIFLFSVILAGLEVISLAIVFPLLQMLLTEVRPSSFLGRSLNLSGDSIHWIMVLTGIVSLYVVKNIFGLWTNHNQSRFLDQLYLHYSRKIYQGFYRQSWTEFTRGNSSEAFRKIKNTAYEFAHNVLHNCLSLLPELLVCFLMIGVVVWIDYRILFILFVLSLPILIFYYFFRKNIISKLDRSFRDLTPQASIILSQGIDSFAEARIYRKENYFIQHFIAISKITTRQLSRLKTFINLPLRLVETIGILCFAVIIIYGKIHPDARQSLLLFLVMLSLVIYRILPSLNKIFVSLSQIQAYAYVVSELQEILTDYPAEFHTKVQNTEFRKSIVLKSVSFQYSEKPTSSLLRNLSVKITKGAFVVVEGASGSGKTTFLHILAGLISNYKGEIFIDDILLNGDTLPSWQSKLALVPQSPVVLQDTIQQNVAFGVEPEDISIDRLRQALELSGIEQLVESLPLKIHTAVGENGMTLSGGQRQRLILARALYRDPEVLLLDEVTNQLDEENKLIVLKNLQLLTKRGKTIVIISHDPVVKKFATHNLHLENSQFIELPVYQSVMA